MNKAKLINDLLKFTIYLQKCISIKVNTIRQRKVHCHAAKTQLKKDIVLIFLSFFFEYLTSLNRDIVAFNSKTIQNTYEISQDKKCYRFLK